MSMCSIGCKSDCIGNNCSSCYDGYYLSSNKCLSCSSNCQTCNIKECTSCFSQIYLPKNNCIPVCYSGSFYNTGSLSCVACSDYGNTCLTCTSIGCTTNTNSFYGTIIPEIISPIIILIVLILSLIFGIRNRRRRLLNLQNMKNQMNNRTLNVNNNVQHKNINNNFVQNNVNNNFQTNINNQNNNLQNNINNNIQYSQVNNNDMSINIQQENNLKLDVDKFKPNALIISETNRSNIVFNQNDQKII